MHDRLGLEGTCTRIGQEKPTFSAHPARFSPDDKYSEQRIKCKKRFGVLRTQTPAEVAPSGKQTCSIPLHTIAWRRLRLYSGGHSIFHVM
eukprot:1867375-Amphidinium_carterae.1